MAFGGKSVQKPRHGCGSFDRARRRNDGKGSLSGRQAVAKSEPEKCEWKDKVETPILTDEHSVFVVKFEEMDNWRTFAGDYMRMSFAEIKVKTKGHVEASLAHARLPVNFESALGADEPVKILDTEGRETAIALYRGMRWSDVKEFKDLPGGDITVNGKTSKKYAEGDVRDLVVLNGPKSLKKKFRYYAERPAEPQNREGVCCLVIAFRNGRGASFKVASVKRGVYFKRKCE